MVAEHHCLAVTPLISLSDSIGLLFACPLHLFLFISNVIVNISTEDVSRTCIVRHGRHQHVIDLVNVRVLMVSVPSQRRGLENIEELQNKKLDKRI